MDNTKEFTTIEFCAGYGGISLGIKRAIPNLRVIALSEIEAFACANLVAKMEEGLLDVAPIWTNLKTFPGQSFRGGVDLLVGGYPCQPFSAAGKRLGKEDPRHLWPYIREQIHQIQPRYCFFENVEGHISLGLSTVISDLEEDGYRTTWGIFSAEEVGAPHRRKRVFILAKLSDTGSKGLEGLRQCSGSQGRKEPPRHLGSSRQVWPARPGQQQYDWEPPRTLVGNTEHDGHAATENRGSSGAKQEEGRVQKFERRCEQAPNDRQIESSLGRNFNESTDRLDNAELYESCDNRTDELRLLGNGVCIPTVTRAWDVLIED